MSPSVRATGFLLAMWGLGWYNLDMNPTAESSAFDQAVAPVLRQFVPNGLPSHEVKFSADPAIMARIEELASKSTEGELTEQERDEYHGYVRANKFIATLRRQIRRVLNSPAP